MASGESHLKTDMIRFVMGPDQQLVPDIAGKLPGRGVWVLANRLSLEKAIKTGGFKRGLKSNVKVGADIVELTEKLLRQRVLSLLTMALKAGQLYMGFDQVKTAAQTERLAWRIEAKDGAAGGRGKIRVLTKAVSQDLGQSPTPVIGCFTAIELGQALGREAMVHVAMKSSPMAKSLKHAVQRLSGFCDLVPESWEDKIHEGGKIPQKETAIKG